DFAAGTRFRSITISDAGYVMNENAAGANKITLLEGFAYNATASGAQFNIPITLGASQTFFVPNAGAQIAFGKLELANLQSLTLDGRGNFDVEGVLSGSGALIKNGDGTLILAANNSTYQGQITANQGAINIRNSNALGTTDAGTIMGFGTNLQLQGGIPVPENLVIRDAGTGFTMSTLGAIRSVGGTNELTGVIAMTNHGSFGVNSGSYLKVSGSILVEPGVSNGGLAKFGGGTL